jgi:hypothetical protein
MFFYPKLVVKSVLHGLSSMYHYFLVKSYEHRHWKLMQSRKVL